MKISEFSPNTVRFQFLSSAEFSKHPTSYYLTIFNSQGCTFPQTYLLFQTDVHALPINLHNCFPGCLVCLSVSQFLSPTDSFILSCLQVGLNVSDLLYEQLHFAWLLACTLFLIRSSLQTASFYHVYQETMVFLISFHYP